MLTGCGLGAGRGSWSLLPRVDSGGLRFLQDKPCLSLQALSAECLELKLPKRTTHIGLVMRTKLQSSTL